MSCHVVRKSLTDTASLTHDAQVLAHHATATSTVKNKVVAFSFHCLHFFHAQLFFLALIDDGLRYRMQRHDKLHLCLLPFLADVLLSVRCRLDMSIFQMLHVGNSQAGKASEDKHPSCLFCFLINYSQSHEFGNIALLQKAYLLFRFLILGGKATLI